MKAHAFGLVCCCALCCGCGQNDQIGDSELFRVDSAQFFRGELPGTPLSEIDADAGTSGDMPTVTAFETLNLTVAQGLAAKNFSGRTSDNATAVAIAMPDVGHGYWLVPTSDDDLATGQPTWNVNTEFDIRIPAGRHKLVAVAFDADGRAGPQRELSLCIASRVPDNLNACDPSKAPPRAVISLTWEENADLDLQVVAPDGRVTNPQRPATTDPLDDKGTFDPSTGFIDRDSNANCTIDGYRMENLVWNEQAPKGRYGIYVNMFSACKQPAVHFRVEVYTAVTDKQGNERLKLWFSKNGELLDLSANRGTARGLFVSNFDF